MPTDSSYKFRTSRRRQDGDSYVLLDRLAYHLSNLTQEDMPDVRDREYEVAAVRYTFSDLLELFVVQDSTAASLIQRTFDDSDRNSRVGLEVELHLDDSREILTLASTELVTNASVFSVRDHDGVSSKARSSIEEFRDEVNSARRERQSVRIHIQRKHHRIRFRWSVLDQDADSFTESHGVLSHLKRIVG